MMKKKKYTQEELDATVRKAVEEAIALQRIFDSCTCPRCEQDANKIGGLNDYAYGM